MPLMSAFCNFVVNNHETKLLCMHTTSRLTELMSWQYLTLVSYLDTGISLVGIIGSCSLDGGWPFVAAEWSCRQN